jgi:hypothetical protein
MKKHIPLIGFIAVASLAFFVRFHDLGRAAVRSDEINFLNLAQRGHSVADLWKNPPWMNQIPLADSIAVMWHWIRSGAPNERTVREPFALIGWLTVLGSSWWLMKRGGASAGLLVGLWMGLLPFHVYQSREAYYYVVVMAFSAGLVLHSTDSIERLWRGQALTWKSHALWTVWAVLTCLTHMSTWVVAGMLWLLIALAGAKKLSGAARRNHGIGMAVSAVTVAAFTIRWIFRALQEMQKVSQADGHLGASFGWVGPRVLPFFTAGANALGVSLSVCVVLLGVVLLARSWRSKAARQGSVYTPLAILLFLGFLTAYAYIGLVGGGAAKISYFTALLPAFLVWASLTLDQSCSLLPPKSGTAARGLLALVIAGLLWTPTLMVIRLDGKPVPYKILREWLDAHLDSGSVAIVDRWYEPWNEMAMYAPSNVVVTFTVPDEPFENYQQMQWRQVTQRAIEEGKAQAFIRLTRNHEARAGLWTWPESFFTRRAVVVNEAGLWSREHGYAANEDFYAANTNRLVAEIFYDLREDQLDRIRRQGRATAVFFGPGLPYEKSGPMGIFRFQTPQFMDWRVLEQRGQLEVYNLTDTAKEVTLRIAALSPRGPKLVSAGEGRKYQFSGNQIQRWGLGPLVLQPGLNVVTLHDPLWDRAMNPLLIAQVDVAAE